MSKNQDMVTSLTIDNLLLSQVGPLLELLKENFLLEINLGEKRDD